MRIKVLQGTVRADREYEVGEELDLPEGEAKAMIREGAVEEVKADEKPKKESKKEAKATPKEAKPDAKAKEESDEAPPKPTMDWTTKEILDYGSAKDVEGLEVEGITKREMIALIEAKEKEERPKKGGEKK